MSNYAEQLYDKLKSHSEADCISIKDDIDALVDLAGDAKDEYNEVEEKIDDIESESVEQQELLDEATEKMLSFDDWGLLGDQIAEEVRAIMNNQKCNQIRFLQALQSYNQTITANKFKSAAL